jgi:TetR/AcrR family transcriptional repressor of mexJK operon
MSNAPSLSRPDEQHCAEAPRSVGRPTLAEAAALRERVLHAARGLFLEQGFTGTSLELIARHAGVHRDTLYRQFGGKEQLFRAVLSAGMTRMRAGIAHAVGRGGRPERVLPRVARQLYVDQSAPEWLALIRMVVAESRRFPDLAADAHGNWVTDLAPLIAYLRTQQAAGILRLDDPAEAAYAFASSAGSTLRLLMSPPLADGALKAHLRRTVAVYLAGWQYRRPSDPERETAAA